MSESYSIHRIAVAVVTLAIIGYVGTLDIPAEVPAFLLFMWLIVSVVAPAFDYLTEEPTDG